MKSRLAFCIALLTTARFCAAQPPKVVSASPDFWSVGVSPTVKSVSITFDQAMRAGFSDWFGRGVLSPASNSHSKVSEDRKTYELDVALQPATVYVLALNEKGLPGVGFQNEKGFAAPPTFLVFQTAGTPPPDKAPPRVVSTIPPNGSQQLDPAKVRAVTINFDQPMDAKKSGLQLVEDKKLVEPTAIRWQYSPDGRAFTAAYDFKSSKTYELTLNSVQNIGFTSANSIPLWPARLAFSTGQSQ